MGARRRRRRVAGRRRLTRTSRRAADERSHGVNITTDRPDAGRAILATLRELPATAPTACTGWTAHHVAAHLAAGSREIADLTEDRAAGRPPRPTRAFEERERPYRAMSYADVLDAMAVQTRRKLAAYEALVEASDESAIDFTGTAITVDELTTHSRSEAAPHRWDLVGDDPLADELLADPELTAHAVKILNRMPVLSESARSIAARAVPHRSPRIVLRAPVARRRPRHSRTRAGRASGGRLPRRRSRHHDRSRPPAPRPLGPPLHAARRRHRRPRGVAVAASPSSGPTCNRGHRQQRRADRRH